MKTFLLILMLICFPCVGFAQTTSIPAQAIIVNKQTGTTYTVLNVDRARLVTLTNGSAVSVTLPRFSNGWYVWVQNRGVGTVTITPSSGTIDGAGTLTLATNQGVLLATDGTNYFTGARGKEVAGGDVVGPGSSTDNAAVRFDGTGGKTLQNSLLTIDDSGSPNIPTGQSYKINSVALAASDVGAQPLDSDLTTIAGLTPTTDNFMVAVSSAWASRTVAQVKSTLSLNNVDNTSDATKNAAAVALTNKTGFNGLTITANGTNTLNIAAGQTLTVPTGGTLGSAAFKATGTSGNTVPLLDGANTWSTTQAFAATTSTASIVGGIAHGIDVNLFSAGVTLSAVDSIGWTSDIATNQAAKDTRLFRNAAGVVGVGTSNDTTANGSLAAASATFTNGSFTLSGSPLIISGNISAATWTTNGVRIKGTPGTLTDTTATTGTTATAYTDVLGGNTIAATNANVVFTNYFTQYNKDPIAGTNVTFTNKWAIGADSAKFGTSNQLTISNTGVLTAIAPVLGTPTTLILTNATGLPLSTGVTGTLLAAQEPAHTGDVTNSAGSLALSIAANAVTLAKLATQATNTVLANVTSGTAVPTALAVGTCGTPGSALIWTTNTGFGCNTAIAASTATTATTATNATNMATVAVSNSASYFPIFAASSSNGNQAFNLGTGLSFNPSTNVLTATTFSGALSGNATTATDTTSKTGTGSTYATSTSPSFTTPAIGAATGTSLAATSFVSVAGTGSASASKGLFQFSGGSTFLNSYGADNSTTGNQLFGNFSANASAGDYFMLLSKVGNLKIGSSGADTLRGTTEGTNQLVLFNGTPPAGTLTNGAAFHVTSGEMKVMDAAGNDTLLSPHDLKTNEWIYDSTDTRTGKRLRIDMERMMKTLNAAFGWNYVHEPDGSPSTFVLTPGDIGGCKVITPTPGATVTITIDATVPRAIASWTSSEIETVNISGTPQDGAHLTLIITNDAGLGRVITLGSGLSALAVVTGVISKKSTVSFVAYSGVFYEVARTVGF